MKIIAVSDSHSDRETLKKAVGQALEGAPIDVFVHCGDGAHDTDAVEAMLKEANAGVRLYTVRGNCDFLDFGMHPSELFEVNGVKIFASHGHLFNVKNEYESLLCAAETQGARVVFFGHTHHPMLEAVRGVFLINPGCVANRLAGNTAYAQVIIDSQGRIKADLMKWLR